MAISIGHSARARFEVAVLDRERLRRIRSLDATDKIQELLFRQDMAQVCLGLRAAKRLDVVC